jgi:membrane protease subunit (stomatin/prohibitin family)
MGAIWDRITSQLIEIIEWLDDDHQTLVWRFPVRGQEIKNGAKLIVREGQSAVFVNEGKLADVFAPNTYTLTTQNLPILSTLKGWKYGFNSPFKAEVYFVSTTQFNDLKWGTSNPIMLRDPEFGPMRLRAFGIFSIRVADPAKLLREVSGTDASYQIEEILGQLKRNLVSRFTSALGNAHVPALDLAGNYDEISKKVLPAIKSDFSDLGIEVTKFFIENISLPPEVEAALDTRSKMGILGNMQQYAAYQAASAIPDAARTPNSTAGAGMGLAAGMAMGNQLANVFAPGMTPQQSYPPGYAVGVPVPGAPGGMMGVMSQPPQPPLASAPPSQAPSQTPMVDRLRKLDALKAAGVLTDEEYQKKKSEILAEI